MCDLVGIPIPASVDGISLVPAMRNAEQPVRDSLYCAYKEYQRSVRDGHYKLIEYVVDGQRTTQLFDIARDPYELDNLAASPGVSGEVTRLRQALCAWRDALEERANVFGETFWRGYQGTE